MYQNIEYEKREEIGIITLNRPDKRNAISIQMIRELISLFEEARGDKATKVFLIKGKGKAFCAGHDLKDILNSDLMGLRELFITCSRMMQMMHELPQPVIAVVHGIATAAGCQLVASCDLAIAGESAQFATPGVKIGVFCHTPMVPLSRAVGRKMALEMLFTGRMISAQEAKQIGLINRVVPDGALEEEAINFAKEISCYSLETLSWGKRIFYEQECMTEKQAYCLATEVISSNATTATAKEGVGAFLEKRTPQWP
jgi:enoyl-CoA hydratase/carnithine racemase